MANGPGLGGIAARTLAALVLVFATYNPEKVSYFHWVIAPLRTGEATSGPASLKFLTGLALLGGWAVFLIATRRSIGIAGAVLVLAIPGGPVRLPIAFCRLTAHPVCGSRYVVFVCHALLFPRWLGWASRRG